MCLYILFRVFLNADILIFGISPLNWRQSSPGKSKRFTILRIYTGKSITKKIIKVSREKRRNETNARVIICLTIILLHA